MGLVLLDFFAVLLSIWRCFVSAGLSHGRTRLNGSRVSSNSEKLLCK